MKPQSSYRKFFSLITISAFLISAVCGLIFQKELTMFDLLGSLFVKLIKLAVTPVVFVAVFQSILMLSTNKNAGKTATLTLVSFVISTATAAAIGFFYSFCIKPGVDTAPIGAIGEFTPTSAPSLKDFILGLVPSNPVAALVEGNTFHVIFVAVTLGLLVLFAGGTIRTKVMSFLDGANLIITNYIKCITSLAPVGVFCLTYSSFAKFGNSAIGGLLKYVLCILASVITIYVLFFVILLLVKKASLSQYMKGLVKIWTVAASTSSSAATLPVSLQSSDEMGIAPSISRFVLPFGTTMNMSGAAQFIAVTFIFLSQISKTTLSGYNYVVAIFIITILVMSTPGIPGGAMVPTIVLLETFGIPVELFAMILGVYSMIDMLDTTLNVTGDVIVACVVEKAIGADLPEETPAA